MLGVKLRVADDVWNSALGEPSRLLLTHHHWRTRRAASTRLRSTRRPSSPSTASASGPPPRSGSGAGNRIELLEEIRYPHSLGLLYSAFTYFCGFKVNSGEYKLMGLAPYGEPRYADTIRDELIDVRTTARSGSNIELLRLPRRAGR